MAENPQAPINPEKIPQQSLTAMIALTEQLQKLNEVMSGAQGSPQSRAATVSRAAQSVRGTVFPDQAQTQAQEALLKTQERQPAGETSNYKSVAEIGFGEAGKAAAGALKRKLKKEGKEGMLEAAFNKPGRVGSYASNPQPTQVEEAEGVRPSYRSEPPGPRSKMFAGMNEGEVERMQREGFKIPQFGEWQLDTKLQMARDWTGQWASKAGDNVMGRNLAGISALANYGQAHAAQIQVIKNLRQKAFGYGENAMGAGAQLGYSPQDGVGPSHVLGLRNPLAYLSSSAGKQGLGMNLDAFKMARLGTGMSLGQAHEIYGSLAGMGFSNQHSGFLGMTTGGDLQNVASGLVAPLARQGMSPGVAASFAESLKTGNVSIRQLHDSIKSLGNISKETRQTLDQSAQSLQGYAQVAVGMGATPTQAYRSGNSFSTITGQNPMIAGQMLQSPVFQGMAMGKYGVLPGAIGTLPGPQIAKTQKESIDFLERIFKNVKPITENGHVVVNAEREREAYVAKELGISASEVRMAKTKAPALEAMARAQQSVEGESSWNLMFGGLEGRAKTPILEARKRRAEAQAGKNIHPGGRGATGQGRSLAKIREEYENHEGEFSSEGFHAKLTPQQEHALRYGGEYEGQHVEGTEDIRKQLIKAGAKGKVKDYDKADLWHKSATAEKILGELGKAKIPGKGANVNGVTIGLTPQAAKLVEIQGPGSAGRAQNEGGNPLTNRAASPGVPE